MLSIPSLIVLLGLLDPGIGPVPPSPVRAELDAGGVERLWETLVLPAGFVLDLKSGVVLSRPRGAQSFISYSGGRLSSATPLRLLPRVSEGRTEFLRDGGEAVHGVSPVVGQDLTFDCFGEAWGLLRILKVSPESLTLEYVLEPDPMLRELRRIPPRLFAQSGPQGVAVRWPGEEGELFLVERRHLAAGNSEGDGPWEEVARVPAGSWVDEDISLGQVTQYRVSLVGDGGRFGAIVIGVPGIEPPEVVTRVGPGTELNLFSAIDDGLRVDLTIETIRSNGVHILPGKGVQARPLTPTEEEAWELSEVLAEGYRNQRYFVSPGRVLALRLPEGVHCLLRVESIGDQSVVLSRQVDLTGDRVFPPAPAAARASWDPERGVVLSWPSLKPAPGGTPRLVIEREGLLDSENWEVCLVGEPGQVEFVDERQEWELLVRYRFRQGVSAERLSPASEPITVLVGGESEEERSALLERAILDLGADDYARRERARAVLVALGEGAWPLLREALRSENPELAASARELLVSGLEGAGRESDHEFARLCLSIKAEELGVGRPPHADWTAAAPGARALATLRGTGWRESTPDLVSAWRRVLAEGDRDRSVKLVAALSSLLEGEGFGLDLGLPDVHLRSGAPSSEVWPYVADSAGRSNEEGQEPWTALVEEQARFALQTAISGGSQDHDIAVQDLALAHSLAAHYRRTGDELFLDCALQLVVDPAARLRGALSLARRRQWEGPGPEVRRVRLLAADTRLLREELESLKAGDGSPVEIVLPAGVYGPLEGGGTLTLEGANFHLRGEGEVELRLSLTLLEGCRGSLTNLAIVPESGIAINVVRSQLRIRDCQIRGGSLGLLGTEALVELEGSSVLSMESAGPGACGLRFGGRSLLLARESRVESPGVAISGMRAALLDRCAVISTGRNAIEGGNNSDLWAVACLIQAEKAPYVRVTRGVLEGVAIVGDLEPSLNGRWGLQACAAHLACDAELADFKADLWLERCSLGR